jgi:hypothetical protein
MAKDDAFLPDIILAHEPPLPSEGTTLRNGNPYPNDLSLVFMVRRWWGFGTGRNTGGYWEYYEGG